MNSRAGRKLSDLADFDWTSDQLLGEALDRGYAVRLVRHGDWYHCMIRSETYCAYIMGVSLNGALRKAIETIEQVKAETENGIGDLL
jgi:hypothetical protein